MTTPQIIKILSPSKRIQRKRTAGWRMPPNTVYVGRPSIYGNPYQVGVDGTVKECLALYRQRLNDNEELRQAIISDLTGKDIACWCAVDAPCHGDVILEIINDPIRCPAIPMETVDPPPIIPSWGILVDSEPNMIEIKARAEAIRRFMQITPLEASDFSPRMEALGQEVGRSLRDINNGLIALGDKLTAINLAHVADPDATKAFVESLRPSITEDNPPVQ